MPVVMSVVSLLALGLSILALVLATVANRRWARRATRAAAPEVAPDLDLDLAPGRATGGPHPQALAGLATQLAELGGHVDEVAAQVAALRAESGSARALAEEALTGAGQPRPDPTALRHVALVRYDAFADVGGRLSYSVALLDDTRSGLVLTTLAGKSDVRTYVRTVSAGVAEGTLTAEEQQAIEAAAASGTAGSRP
jgi:hypothetical protein